MRVIKQLIEHLDRHGHLTPEHLHRLHSMGLIEADLPADPAALWEMPIDDLELIVRTHNCLKRVQVHTVGQLIAWTEAELLEIRSFQPKCVDEVKYKLGLIGLSLREERGPVIPVDDDNVDAWDAHGDGLLSGARRKRHAGRKSRKAERLRRRQGGVQGASDPS